MKYLKWINKHIPSLEGKIIVVTGANSGIGFYCTKALCYKGALVIMACRSLERATKAKERIQKENPQAKIDIIHYDQASFASIDLFAEKLKEKYPSIDGLILNAGIYYPKDKNALTKEHIGLTIGTNYLGVVRLIEDLNDYISSQNHLRIIVTGSVAARRGKIVKNDDIDLSLNKSRFKQYSYSKYLLMKYASYLTSKFPHQEVIMAHPGISATNIFHNFPKIISKAGVIALSLLFHCPEKASLVLTYGVSSPFLKSGELIGPRGLFSFSGYPCERRINKKIPQNAGIISEKSIKIIKEINTNALRK